MSKVFFISDLHFHHKKILQFAGDYRDGDTVEEQDHILVAKWNMVVGKRDKVFVLGDVVMNKNLDILEELNGRKILIRGNHDHCKTEEYLKYFDEVHGIMTYKGYWVTHAPIHPHELRGRSNIHGHVHQNLIRDYYGEADPRYICVCVENCDGFPVDFQEIETNKWRKLQ